MDAWWIILIMMNIMENQVVRMDKNLIWNDHMIEE